MGWVDLHQGILEDFIEAARSEQRSFEAWASYHVARSKKKRGFVAPSAKRKANANLAKRRQKDPKAAAKQRGYERAYRARKKAAS